MHASRRLIRTIGLAIALGFVAVVAAIAIVGFKLARMTANEASARRSLHAINSAQAKFAESDPSKGYACSLRTLGDVRLIPDSLAAGKYKGYLFEISNCGSELSNRVYRVFAHPVEKDKTGSWVFCSDRVGRVKGSPESREDCFLEGVVQP
jgi:hypothetical protein